MTNFSELTKRQKEIVKALLSDEGNGIAAWHTIDKYFLCVKGIPERLPKVTGKAIIHKPYMQISGEYEFTSHYTLTANARESFLKQLSYKTIKH